jgi:putative ABC transport system permease protein
LTAELSASTISIEDHPRPASEPQFTVWVTTMTPELPATLGLRLLRGRHFTHADHAKAAPVSLISRAMAQRFWPNQDPVGRRWRPVWMTEWRTIVGVVDDVQTYSITGMPDWVSGTVYMPLAQTFTTSHTLALVARVHGDPAGFEQALPGLAAKVCRECAVSKIARIETVVSEAARAPRATATLTSAFAALALAMAAVGLFGVMSHSVTRRGREFGIRLALGATRASVAWLVLRSAVRDTLLGAAIGLAVAAGLARLIGSLLHGVDQWDPASFAAAPVFLIVVTIAASAVPLWRASTTNATQALREN